MKAVSRPIACAFLMMSQGTVPFLSYSRATGRISRSANSCAVFWRSLCSSVRSNSTIVPAPPLHGTMSPAIFNRWSLTPIGDNSFRKVYSDMKARGYGMAIRLTKDLLAAFITSVFLLWILASAFAPLILHVQVYNDKGQTLVALDLLAAAFCL